MTKTTNCEELDENVFSFLSDSTRGSNEYKIGVLSSLKYLEELAKQSIDLAKLYGHNIDENLEEDVEVDYLFFSILLC